MNLENMFADIKFPVKKISKKVCGIGKSFSRKMKRIGTALVLATALSATPYAAHPSDKDEVYGKVILGNCALQGVVAGIGGMQNGKSFLESLVKGCLGGATIAGGKIMVANDINNAWPAKLMTSLGTSMVYNTSNGEPLLNSFGFDFGPAFFEWKKDKGFNTYLLPDSLGYALYFAAKGYKLDLTGSLRYGNPLFIADELGSAGVAGANITAILKKKKLEKFGGSQDLTLKHESIHTHQYASSRALGNIVLNPIKNVQSSFEDYNIKLDHAVGHHLLQITDLYYDTNKETHQEREAYNLTE